MSFASVSKGVFERNHSYENEFALQVNFHVNQARRLAFKQGNSEWPIGHAILQGGKQVKIGKSELGPER